MIWGGGGSAVAIATRAFWTRLRWKPKGVLNNAAWVQRHDGTQWGGGQMQKAFSGSI